MRQSHLSTSCCPRALKRLHWLSRAAAVLALALPAGSALAQTAPDTDSGSVPGAYAPAPDARAAALSAQQTAASGSSTATGELQPFQASYFWLWRGMEVALSTISFQQQSDDTWVYSSSSKPRGLGRLYPMRPNLRSVMRVLANGVVEPLSFKASGSGRSHDADVQFDWQRGRANGLYEGAKVDLAIKPGVQDDLSVQIAMLAQLLQGRTPDVALELNQNVVREYDYERIGEETLDTALGKIATIVYEAHHAGSPRTTSFWCAPSLGFIPLQVQQKRLKAVEWTMKIRSLQTQHQGP